jgi:hypothetical protein
MGYILWSEIERLLLVGRKIRERLDREGKNRSVRSTLQNMPFTAIPSLRYQEVYLRTATLFRERWEKGRIQIWTSYHCTRMDILRQLGPIPLRGGNFMKLNSQGLLKWVSTCLLSPRPLPTYKGFFAGKFDPRRWSESSGRRHSWKVRVDEALVSRLLIYERE